MEPQHRVIIENVSPEIDHGQYAVKRVIGQWLMVEADIYADGHDIVQAQIGYRHASQAHWQTVRMKALSNDRWQGRFKVELMGAYQYTLQGWIDHALNWQHNIGRKIKDGQKVSVELLDGLQYLQRLLPLCTPVEGRILQDWMEIFQNEAEYPLALMVSQSVDLHTLFVKYPYQPLISTYPLVLPVWVDRSKALFSAWYEFFPRSASYLPGQHGTFAEAEKILPRIADLGFDTIYLPPIHPIGTDFRKGKNNTLSPTPEDVGSPWAIGNVEGGHKAIHPQLGTLEDFRHFVQKAKDLGLEIALDYALQCSPNHPYVKAYPQWFRWRPDGTVQYAENPPKKYQDILPINFETEDWQNLWEELKSILLFWVNQGVSIFRVDNPHTKSFVFWEWVIAEVKKQHPEVLFLSEAFTRPKVMHQLAKLGFSQSYTYYTWRNTRQEITAYMQELTQGPGREYFRPNFWPNTPDINPYPLQGGQENLFLIRYFMAATLSSNYGIYGPVYEYMVHQPYPNKEEYLDSEKYETKVWDWSIENRLTALMRKVNRARRSQPALQQTNHFHLCGVNNEALLAYYKHDEACQNHLLLIVNLDPYHTQVGGVRPPFEQLEASPGDTLIMHDLLTGQAYPWMYEYNYVSLNPYESPFHLFRIEKQVYEIEMV
ncbi:MAG: alpha-1,4-glucan--maltose-1-phosphate maltosyltransferase [Microscillaceae bacterium]|nr:alpha-1,4-glucan--maltose-1-phosphate maltosyltransferase [Microscillaceae bacterium]